MFHGCKSLTTAELPNDLKSFNCGLFGNCNKLTSVKLPDAVTNIGCGMFEIQRFGFMENNAEDVRI